MAVQILRKLRLKWCSDSDEYLPEDINKEKWYKIVGTESWHFKQEGGKYPGKTKTSLKFIIVNDKGFTVSIPDFNCNVAIDEDEEE